jgi:hypothetical protein
MKIRQVGAELFHRHPKCESDVLVAAVSTLPIRLYDCTTLQHSMQVSIVSNPVRSATSSRFALKERATILSLCPAISISESHDGFSRKVMGILCHLTIRKRCYFEFPLLSNNDMADAQTCDVAATLAARTYNC